ncbi:MAG: 2-C-methyl-D-erythritol 4-phosphate cytidylyltransferase [Lentisphaeria bacterium]|jgi:2-C-methyl-D-erythritol 4-phosphate cytidylyltransferase
MASERPKQYLPLLNQTLIEVTVKKLLACAYIEGVIVALSDRDTYWQHTTLAHHHKIFTVIGGCDRSDSVYKALCFCKEKLATSPSSCAQKVWALVHDAARPCVSLKKIDELANLAVIEGDRKMYCGAILATPVSDTIKRVGDKQTILATEDRSQLWSAHTPQLFPLSRLIEALSECQEKNIVVTDEASAIEATGGKVRVVMDRQDNIKVTVPEDLALAEYLLTQGEV